MCSTPSMQKVENNTPTIQTPTLADAQVSKASTNTRSKATSTAGRNIRTSARGLLDDANTTKKGLLGE